MLFAQLLPHLPHCAWVGNERGCGRVPFQRKAWELWAMVFERSPIFEKLSERNRNTPPDRYAINLDWLLDNPHPSYAPGGASLPPCHPYPSISAELGCHSTRELLRPQINCYLIAFMVIYGAHQSQFALIIRTDKWQQLVINYHTTPIHSIPFYLSVNASNSV